eukprot:jgi/Chlat1/5609/Chrsp369S00862
MAPPGPLRRRSGRGLLGLLLALVTLAKVVRAETPANTDPTRGPVSIDYRGEFGFEMVAIYPWVYYQYVHGRLNNTVGCGHMAPFYWFSPNHVDDPTCKRMWFKLPDYVDWPYDLHRSALPDAWLPPPLARHYRCMPPLITTKKPIMVISNKYEMEWNKPPINFIPTRTLLAMLRELTKKFTIVYNRAGDSIPMDHQQSLELHDKEQIRAEFGGTVLMMQDIATLHGLSFNEAQLRVMSRASHFISVQGGSSILSSYFGGKNIVFVKRGGELLYDAFHRIFPFFNRSWVVTISREDELLLEVRRMVDRPLVPPNKEVVDEFTLAKGLGGCSREPDMIQYDDPNFTWRPDKVGAISSTD